MISYHPKAKRSYAYLYRHYNDIDVYVEDTTCRNTYEILLNRILDWRARITRVIQLGGRNEVLRTCQDSQDLDERPSIYIIDADFDLLLDIPAPEIDRLYRLQAFNVENLLIDETAAVEVAVECMPNTEKADVVSALDFTSLLNRAAEILIPLFYVYAAAKTLNDEIETVGRCVESMCLQGKRELRLSKKKVTDDAFLRQCPKLRNHYTTGSELIYINNYVFRITCQGILMKTIYLLSQMLLLFKLLFATGHNALSQTIMALFRSDKIYA